MSTNNFGGICMLSTDYALDWMNKRSAITPNKIAISDFLSKEEWTFQEVNQRATSMANFLLNNDISKGDRIALLAPNHISYFDLLFACMKIGAIFVPLNWRLSSNELKEILDDCAPKILFYHDDFSALSSDIYKLKKVNINSKEYIGSVNIQPSILPIFSLTATDPLVILYTGGTTGKSKGVVLSHRSISANAMNTILSWNLTFDDVTPTYLPMFHTGGLNSLTIPVLQIGGRVVIIDKFEPNQAIDVIENEKCTVCLMVPTMYQSIIQLDSFSKASFSSMHTFISGGAPCPHTVYEAFSKKELSFKEGYGLTEAGPNNFYIHPNDAIKKVGSVGKEMMINSIQIVDENYNVLGENMVGEILLKGPHLFEYYWQNESATNEAFINGWFKTGDFGKKDADGYFYIVGRKKDMIISGGENIYPTEIENILINYPLVKEVSVIGLPDEKWGESVCAVIVSENEEEIDTNELKAYCIEKLGRYKVPRKFIFIKQLPKTHVGKIDKKQLIVEFS
jgi:fatty-acyl-CoA synthase